MPDDSASTPENNFEMFWTEFDRYYPFFVYKQIDWDSLHRVYRPQVTSRTTGDQLFGVLYAMVDTLQDGHIWISTPYGTYYGRRRTAEPAPTDYSHEVIEQSYLVYGWTRTGGNRITYGRLRADIGYAHISHWGGDGWASDIDDVLETFRGLKGLVVDVRNNPGGSTDNALSVASRFADERRLYGYVQYRSGPRHTDFTDLIPAYVEPGGRWRWTKPATVLTNGRVASASEEFVLAMRVFSHVTVIGGTTAGSSGNPIGRELPNGWVYRVPRWIAYTPEHKMYEGIGLFPDIPVRMSSEDRRRGKDTMIETALQVLSSKM